MRHLAVLDKFKDKEIALILLKQLRSVRDSFNFMEVCGTHTMQIFKTGIRDALPENIRLISGPGCPVCVTTTEDIDKAIAIAKSKDVILFCFGDMIKVRGSKESLADIRPKVKVMYSPLEALEFAQKNRSTKVVLFGVGFETTIPAFAATLIRAKNEKIKNLFIFTVFKLIPPAISAILSSKEVNIDGFILPGHVSTIIGRREYEFICDVFKIPAVITGFEMVDILEGLLFLCQMKLENRPQIRLEYSRVVSPEGNRLARRIVYEVFQKNDSQWRGLGKIPDSGLKLNDDFREFDVGNFLDIRINNVKENNECLCGSVLKGIATPLQCRLFGKRCRPDTPVGPCMVSSEGTCAAYYKYKTNTQN